MSGRFDIAVVGCGIVGLAILRRFAMAGLKCIALEKGADILSGASKGNSALLHTAFDAPPKSLEWQCMQAGRAAYLEIAEKLDLPILETSAIVAAWSDDELLKLEAIENKARQNGIEDVKPLTATELRIREPQLSREAKGGLLVPGEHVIDPWSTPLAYALQAIAHGATIRRSSEVKGAKKSGAGWLLQTASGDVEANIVINAAGLHGDHIEALVRTPGFAIKPRKGQFVVFDKPASKLLRAILLPVPTARTKGVVLFRTIFGNLAIGPTAEEVDERDQATTDTATLEMLKVRAIAMVPALETVDVTAIYAGLRPATAEQDYVIKAHEDENWITVAGIRSTGLTAALGIAQYVAKLYAKHFGKLPRTIPEPVWTPVPNLAEHRIRPYMKGGEIMCHCEWVTRGEIEAALQGPLPAGDLGGLKRRTRATMGRCQGFYCAAHVSAAFDKAQHGTP